MAEHCFIIGLGQIGMGYDLELDPAKFVFSHARAFSLHEAFELSGAVDPSAEQRKLYENHYGKPAYADIKNALRAEKPTVVVIATPTALHREAVNMILSYSKPKLILCEKPLAYNPLEAREMVEACQSADVQLFVNYMRRVDIGVLEVKKRITEGVLSLPIKGVVWYSKGFLHNGSHFFNLLEFWLGSFVRAEILNNGRLWDNKDPEPDVFVEFENGKVVFISAWEEAFSHYTIELLCPSGRLRYEQGGAYIIWQSTIPHPTISGYSVLQPDAEEIVTGMNRNQWYVADQVADFLAGRRQSLCTGSQALATLEAMQQIINQRG